MVSSPNRTRSLLYGAPHSPDVVSNRSLWNAQPVLTKPSKHRIVSKFHADAFTHYHQVSRVYVPATDETDRVVAKAILPFPSTHRR